MRIHLFSWIFFLPFCSIILGLESDVVWGQSHNDQPLMLQLRNTLLSSKPFSEMLKQWNRSSDYCHWDGVTCNNGRVTGLNLLGEYISGDIENLSLFSLQNLKSLDLSLNNFSGTFPTEIFQVPTLQNIDISHNPFLRGSLPEFPQNNVLQSLVLVSTNFSGMLPTSIGHLWNLSKLDLTYCQFYGPFPNSVDNLTQLVHLDLSGNKFNGPISSVHWGGLLKLAYLDLSNNSLSGSIPPSLFTIPSLEYIYLSDNQFDGDLPEFSNSSSSVLHTLDLRRNNLEGPIPTSIFNLQNVESLSLSFNKLNGTVHWDNIQGLRNVIELDLSHNNLSVIQSDNDSTLSSFIRIAILRLASCKIRAIPCLENQEKLHTLDLSDNQINGVLPNWVWLLGKGSLITLNLSHNHLVSIQQPQYYTPDLYILDLHSNKISGNMPVLPENVYYVDLSHNNFTSIPEEVGDGAFRLNFFSLSNNDLTGAIPKSICNASKLQVLDLSNNGLSGEIPACISAMSQTLGVLNLRGNKFNSSIPNEFPTNCTLQTLDLNGNSLKGQIPKSLVRCTKLKLLNLGNNHLTGQFPCMLKSISTLRVVVLRSNNFHGNLGCPNTNGTWEMLQIVDLSHNNFSGHLTGDYFTKSKPFTTEDYDKNLKLQSLIFYFSVFILNPKYENAVKITLKGMERELVSILTVFTSIDLSCNNFVGQIPEEFGQLHALYFLNLSHNSFTGPIPSSIGKMGHLESLDLSRNKLSGSIPASLASLNFLALLNLSYNDLTGLIPSGPQIQTFPPESFIGNKALWGCPLTQCSNSEAKRNRSSGIHSRSENWIDWNLISVEMGFIVGFRAVVAPLFFKRWRKMYFKHIDDIGVRLFPKLYQFSFNNKNRRRKRA